MQIKYIDSLPYGGWCTYQNTYRLEGLRSDLGNTWQQNVSEHLVQQIYWVQQLKHKTSKVADACQRCQKTDIREFFYALERLPQSKFSSHHIDGLGLDMNTMRQRLHGLILLLPLLAKTTAQVLS